MTIIIILIGVVLFFPLWDWLTTPMPGMGTGTLQGMREIGNHPEWWSGIVTGLLLCLGLIAIGVLASVIILPILGSGGMSKAERDRLNK